MDDLIREEAYYVWETRMKWQIPGTPEGDWKDAENKIKNRQWDDIISPYTVNRMRGYIHE